METISVGMMLPSSGIRKMSKDFSKAFKKAVNHELNGSDYEVEVIAEMIGNGAPVQVELALDKMFGFHGVDIVTGIASHSGIRGSVDKFKKQEVPLLLNNLGEHMVPDEGYNDYVFHNSVHLWQQSWLLGYYAGKELGENSFVLAAMYDSGYAFLIAYEMGLRAANPDINHRLKLLPLPEPGQLSNVKEGFDEIDLGQYDFIYALFCGEEATMFLEEFKARKLHDKVKLLGLPFLLEQGDSDLSDVSVYTVNHQEEDLLYDQIYKDMGTFSGMAIGKAILAGEGEFDADTLKSILSEMDDQRVLDSTESARLLNPVGIYKCTFEADKQLITEKVFEQVIDLETDAEFNSIKNMENSNWVNPYLSI